MTDVLRSPGQPLDAGARASMEPQFGYDFSGVRVHTDARAAESARALNSLAYTSGKKIVFAHGAYAPNSSEGQRLLAHELTHIVQQGSSRDAVQHHVSRPTDSAEQEADRTAAAITQSQPAPPITSPAPGIHRDAGGAGQTRPEPPCSMANTSTSTRATIYPIVVASDDGSNPTPEPPLNQVRAIWAKCCILFGSVYPPAVVRSTSLKTLPIRPPAGGSATPEETSLFNAAGNVDGIQIICVDQFSRDGVTGKNVAGGGKTYDAGTAHPRIVIVSGIAPEIVAHEVGHATGFKGHNAAAATVMEPTNAYNAPSATAVSSSVCTKARSGSVLSDTGNSCCLDPA